MPAWPDRVGSNLAGQVGEGRTVKVSNLLTRPDPTPRVKNTYLARPAGRVVILSPVRAARIAKGPTKPPCGAWCFLHIECARGDKRLHTVSSRSPLPCPSHSDRGRGGGVLDIMHDRSRMTIDPLIPVMPEWSTSSFRRPSGRCLRQAPSTVTCLASRTKRELHLAKNRL